MINILKRTLEQSYAPYSKVKVAAVVVTSEGKMFTGVNIENASFGATICAERVAITKAISEGYKDLKEIHILSNLGEKTMPCFICRQVLLEFFEKEDKVFVYDESGNFDEYRISDLCPYPFDKEDLK